MKSLKSMLLSGISSVAIVLSLSAVTSTASAGAASCLGNELVGAECQMAGVKNGPATQSYTEAVGYSASITGLGNMNLDSFAAPGFDGTVGGILCGSPFQTSGTFGEECTSLTAASTYIVLVYETSGNAREWVIASALGSALQAGVSFLENSSEGTAKYDVFVFTQNDDGGGNGNVPVPATLALLGLGLLGLGFKRK